MEQAHIVKDVQKARILFKPLRLEIMRQLAEPQTCQDLAETFGASPQKIYYHVKTLEHAGFIEKIGEEPARGLRRGIYQAAARSFWISPKLADRLPRAKDSMSLEYLMGLAEQVHIEASGLGDNAERTPTLAINAQIELANREDRAAFLDELRDLLTGLAEKYGSRADGVPGTELYRLMVASYPLLD